MPGRLRKRWHARRGPEPTGVAEPEAVVDAPVAVSEDDGEDNGADGGADEAYLARLQDEIDFHKDYLDISALPAIFGYWANTYLLPMLQDLGVSSCNEFVAQGLHTSAHRCGVDEPVFASLGAGNCDTEVAVAHLLRERGLDRFRIECVDINPHMLDRGRDLAAAEGLVDHVVPVLGDFNAWRPGRTYQGLLANQSLHHVVNLEGLFDAMDTSLDAKGSIVVNDMIGRNGHMRWPEALAPLQEFWKELPESYRYNQQLKRLEIEFDDWDCSQRGFEGLRSQDILPLLAERFEFETFLAFGNVVDVFIDRNFGHNFDSEAAWDREFIDRVHAFDEAGLADGTLTPTHLFATLGKQPVEHPYFARGLGPRASIRAVDASGSIERPRSEK